MTFAWVAMPLVGMIAHGVDGRAAMRVAATATTSSSSSLLLSLSVCVGAVCAVLLIAFCSSRKQRQQKVELLLTQQRRMTQIQHGYVAPGGALKSTRSNMTVGSVARGFSGPVDDIKLRSEDISVGSRPTNKRSTGLSSHNESSSHHSYQHQSHSQVVGSQPDVIRTGSYRNGLYNGQPSGSGSNSHTGSRGHPINSARLIASQTETSGAVSDPDEETLEMWRLDEAHVKAISLLSRGSYGEVWFGEYRGTPVAIKKLLASRSTHDEMKKFVAEIVLMTKLDSQYIVKFIGVSWFRKAEMMLIIEYMDQGDLRSILEQTNPDSFPLEDKLNCALAVAEGLVYLHTLDTTIIHRDIKSRNVLLDSRKGTKLTDFGVSRETTSETMTIGIGTYRWMAPEILTDSHYSHAADIYSFGVILAELDTHLLPYSDQLSDKGKPLNDTAIMGRVMQGSIQPTFSSLFPAPLFGLAKQCLSYRPEDRPTSMEIAHHLRQFRKRYASSRLSYA
ncbi:hypothetical protein AC1031_020447 [Aphanomyces cochlioides]|nr:hypothetical protein AC1031_020447 [Aphanomyces cochlioides]